MIERREELRFAPEARQPIGVDCKGSGKNLQRDVAPERRVARTIDLAHAACPQRAGDLMRAETGAGDEWHQLTGTRRFNSSCQFCTTMTPTPAVCWVDLSATSR